MHTFTNQVAVYSRAGHKRKKEKWYKFMVVAPWWGTVVKEITKIVRRQNDTWRVTHKGFLLLLISSTLTPFWFGLILTVNYYIWIFALNYFFQSVKHRFHGGRQPVHLPRRLSSRRDQTSKSINQYHQRKLSEKYTAADRISKLLSLKTIGRLMATRLDHVHWVFHH